MDWKTPVTLTGKFVHLEPLSEAHVPGLTAASAGDEASGNTCYAVRSRQKKTCLAGHVTFSYVIIGGVGTFL